jgi:hypothetical protein
MAGKTAYFEKAVLNLALRNTSFSPATPMYVALFTAAPTDAYTSASPDGTEVSGNAYARQVIAFGAPSGTPSACANSGTINFPAATPGAWGVITHFAIFDALTNGNLLYWNSLTASKTVNATDIFQFAAASISISED